jgi:hypothetical protein
MPTRSMSKIKIIYNYIINIVKISVPIFLAIVYIDILIFLSGGETILIHIHQNLIDIFIGSVILLIVYIVSIIVNFISKKKWKKLLFLILFLLIMVSGSLLILNIFSVKAKLNSFNYVKQLFSEQKFSFDVNCEDNVKRDFDLFSKKFSMSAIKAIQHYPFLGRHIFIVKSEGIAPFIIDMRISFSKKNFVWVHSSADSLSMNHATK